MAHIQKPREITALSARLAGSARHKLYVHLGGGLRAVRIDDATRAPFADWRFLLYPVVGAGGNAVGPYGMSEIRANTAPHGLSVLGVDDVEDDQAVLRMRMWYPMSAASGGIGTGADLWSNLSINQPEDADARDVALARYLAFSLRAAGIRIRDASDQYHKQLKVALAGKTKDSARFSNVATIDLALAIHATLSELASARDYLAAWFARRLGAPAGIDALNRLMQWLPKAGAASNWPPGLEQLVQASDEMGLDPWAWHLAQLRNLHIHRQPVGLVRDSHAMVFRWVAFEGKVRLPTVSLVVTEDVPQLDGQDYLRVIDALFVKFEACAAAAARGCGISFDIPVVKVPPTRPGA